MANIFVDVNLFFDIASRHREKAKLLNRHKAYLSPLSCHIYCYAEKVAIPDRTLNLFLENFEIISLTDKILKKAMRGPTKDLEDNIQLHSAVKAGCSHFLTNDEKLLSLKRFKKMKIASSL